MATDWGLAVAWGSLEQELPQPVATLPNASTIARLVHHSVILELNLPSYLHEAAKRSKAGPLPE